MMGRRRNGRFAQVVDDDSSGEPSQPSSGGASAENIEDQEQAKARKRKGRDDKAEVLRRHETEARRRGRGRPLKRRGKEAAAAAPVELKQGEAAAAEPAPHAKSPTGGALAEDVMDEEEEEQQTRRCGRNRPPKQRVEEAAEPVERQKEEKEEKRDAGVVELAVPIGEPVRITGRRGKKPKKHYSSFQHNGRTFQVEDFVMISPEDEKTEKPYVAIIKNITEDDDGNLIVQGRWFYRPEDTEIEGGGDRDTRELFYSLHIDYVPAESVMHTCVVHFIPQHKQIPARKQHPGFFVQKVYGTVEKQLWNLSGEDYEEKLQKEIDLLVKRTMDRIGELPDLEPEGTPSHSTDPVSNKRSLQTEDAHHPIDVTREPRASKKHLDFEKAETPASPQLKNYAILARYNALTGVERRDKWLDKLLESVPLAWSKEIVAQTARADPGASTKNSSNVPSTKIAGSDNNEKSYGFNNVVPIIASLERSVYDALGTADFRKYNSKMVQLWYNIKHSSKLRARLMNKELDPLALLTMSPDELKVGRLTSAVKTSSEPEQSRQLQTTDAGCLRCQEKKVRIACSIHAGNRECYQLECTSCGHTWSSSHDAVSSLTEGGPSTVAAAAAGKVAAAAGTVATAAWGRGDGQQQQHVRKNKSKTVPISEKTVKPIPEDN